MSEAEDFKFRMAIINDYVKRDFVLGEKDRGFAIFVLNDFMEYLNNNNLTITKKDA
jgi:hypothetical protein